MIPSRRSQLVHFAAGEIPADDEQGQVVLFAQLNERLDQFPDMAALENAAQETDDLFPLEPVLFLEGIDVRLRLTLEIGLDGQRNGLDPFRFDPVIADQFPFGEFGVGEDPFGFFQAPAAFPILSGPFLE